MPKKDSAPDETQPEQGGTVDLTPHPLVAAHEADADDIQVPPDTVSLIGYIGTSKRPDYTRLYLDLSFRNYYEIPTAGIASTSPINSDDENSPTHVQVYADTKVDVVSISAQSIEARYLSGSISSGLLGAAAAPAQAAGAQGLCGNITTYMPSCLQPPCGNITTHIPSCLAPQGLGAAAAAPAQGLCTNITTYIPSCVAQGGGAAEAAAQPLCGNITTHIPSCLQPPCGNITTHMPSCLAQPGVGAAAQPFCGNITTHIPSCIQGPPLCLTVVTANPTDCGQACNPTCIATIVTSGVPQAQAVPAQTLCTNITTHIPSCVGGACIPVANTLATTCTQVHCAVPGNTAATLCTQQTVAQAGLAQPAAAAACITIATHYPTWCPPQCNPNCVATIVTSHMPPQAQAAAAAPVCITLNTANPSNCGPVGGPICVTLFTGHPTCNPPCIPIANTAATLCTQIHGGTTLTANVCAPTATVIPTGGS